MNDGPGAGGRVRPSLYRSRSGPRLRSDRHIPLYAIALHPPSECAGVDASREFHAPPKGEGPVANGSCRAAAVPPLPHLQIALMLGTMLSAGTDTTSVTMEWVLLLLVAHPECQRKVQAELDAFYGTSGRTPTAADQAHLPYLMAVLYEAMRFRPVAPLLVPHRTTADVTLMGYDVPADTQVWEAGRAGDGRGGVLLAEPRGTRVFYRWLERFARDSGGCVLIAKQPRL